VLITPSLGVSNWAVIYKTPTSTPHHHRLAAAEHPRAGLVLEPARPETADDTPRDLTSRSTTFQPDERSWDFDGYESTSARNRTRRSPMLSHETLPDSGASVVGMTIWVGQGQSHLPADVPGITATSGQEADFDQGAGCASSRLRSSPLEARAGEDDENH
jgi:hypothetical protein